MGVQAISIETATLAAAGIAAAASVVGLIANVYAKSSAEMRAAHRATLHEDLATLGESLHQIMACADILLRAKSEESLKTWRARGKVAAESLKNLRPKLRYPLWGLDEGLRVLSYIPDWTDHARVNPEGAKRLVRQADRLRRVLDNSIRRCYRKGRCPSLLERLRVRWHTARCRYLFTDGKPRSPDEAGEG